MSPSLGFIRYQTRGKSEYGTYCHAVRDNGKKTNNDQWLGKVINKEKGIFWNRSDGYYTFTIADGVSKISEREKSYFDLVKKEKTSDKVYEPKLLLDFGDIFVLHEVLRITGLLDLFSGIFSDKQKRDTLLGLIGFKLLHNRSNCYANSWFDNSYASLLYQNARLESQRISEFLSELGQEKYLRTFFSKYHEYIGLLARKNNVLIDSTGLINDISFPLTAINNHNGVINEEIRLILVVDRSSGFPLYFKYVPGNIVDVSTLPTVYAELKALNIKLYQSIMDAGYYSEKNIKVLYQRKIQFIIRVVSGRTFHTELVNEHAHDLIKKDHIVYYRNRVIFIKMVRKELFGKIVYAYICIDLQRRHMEERKFIEKLKDEYVSDEDFEKTMDKNGLFVLISSFKIKPVDILPLYYTRQAIEQVFDTAKNNVDLIPLRVHGEDTFRGHLFLSFLACIASLTINQKLEGTKYCSDGALFLAGRLKCSVYNNIIIPGVANKDMNEIIKHLKIKIPLTINCGE